MQQPTSYDNPLLVLIGMAGSGKSTVARHLERRGWRTIRFGEITMREVEARGLPISEPNEKAVREELRATHGMAAYAKLSLPDITEALDSGPLLIDGLYSWSEYRYLKDRFGRRMQVVAIFTARALRYARLSRRAERPLTEQEAEQRDFAEIENLEKGGPIAIADYTILNNGTEADMLAEVDRLLAAITPGPR
jgi:dephospho-CoA kinase